MKEWYSPGKFYKAILANLVLKSMILKGRNLIRITMKPYLLSLIRSKKIIK
jgi:hypothetical protein